MQSIVKFTLNIIKITHIQKFSNKKINKTSTYINTKKQRYLPVFDVINTYHKPRFMKVLPFNKYLQLQNLIFSTFFNRFQLNINFQYKVQELHQVSIIYWKSASFQADLLKLGTNFQHQICLTDKQNLRAICYHTPFEECLKHRSL